MKGVVFDKAGEAPKVVDTLERPVPSPDQILVRSLYTAINPVDSFMAQYGTLVLDWPLVLGVDAAGVVVEVGEKARSKFKVGDFVCGCTRLGSRGYSTCQELYLMDAEVTMLKPQSITIQQAATIGVGTETAALALFGGLHVALPDPSALDVAPTGGGGEYIVVLGGASSVGKYAIQLARAAGYQVVASCSARSADIVRDLDATPFDYKKPLDKQVEEVMGITGGGNFSRVFDAVASADAALAQALFKALKEKRAKGDGNEAATQKESEEKLYFATTNDWSNLKAADFGGAQVYEVRLGPVGRPDATQLNAELARYIPVIEKLVKMKELLPNAYDEVGKGGWEAAIEAYRYQSKGAGGSNKVVVKLQDP